MYVVIMASGQGTRLWPLSRRNNPKQFHALVSDKSLLRETFERVSAKFSPEKIFIAITQDCLELARAEVPEISADNFIVEPFANETAGTIGIAAKIINLKDPESSLLCMASDHLIKDKAAFVKTLDFVERIVEKNPTKLLQIGIKPTAPDTGLGYTELGAEVERDGELAAYNVERFVEKPDMETAEKFLQSGRFLWNACMYSFKTSHLLNLYKKHLPKNYQAIQNIGANLDSKEVWLEQYNQMDRISIDYGIAEKTSDLLVVAALFDWSDIGSWSTLLDSLSSEGVKVISRGHHLDVGSENSLVYAGDKLIATVGLEDTVVIDTPDVTFICNKNKSQEVKALIEKLKEEDKEKYL